MISLLISGGTLESRQEAVKNKEINNIYNLELGNGEEAVSIEEVRALQKTLSLAVTDDNTRLCVLWEVQNLSLPAQQALLKLIEEPPAQTQIILTTDNANLLPATILSRCVLETLETPKYELTPDETTEVKQMLQVLSSKPYAASLKLAESVVKTEDPSKTIINLLMFIRGGMLQAPSLKRAEVIRILQTCLSDLKTNINSTLVLEHCFLSIRQLNEN